MAPALAGGFSSTGPPGKPLCKYFEEMKALTGQQQAQCKEPWSGDKDEVSTGALPCMFWGSLLTSLRLSTPL